MILSLELTYFRQHESLTIGFTKGLNVLRGKNESGKTTITEGILYAYYGAAALIDSLSEVVTWGHKEPELKVKLVAAFSGVEYTFTRSKAGAEVNYPGGKVTGQKEVTKFAADLLGADEKTGTMMMMASQAGIRGALDDGPAKVSELIGRLADFDLIDRALDQGQKSLMLGSEEPLRLRLAEAIETMAALQASAPSEDAARELVADLASAEAGLALGTRLVDDVLQPAFMATTDALDAATAGNTAAERRAASVARLGQKLATERARLVEAQAGAVSTMSEAVLPGLQAQIAAAATHQVLVDKFKAFNRLQFPPLWPESAWKGSRQTLLAEHASLAAKMAADTNKVGSLQGEIRGLEGNILTQGNCPTCGQTVNGDAHIAERNAALATKVDALVAEIHMIQASYRATKVEFAGLKLMLDTGDALVRAAEPLADVVAINDSTYPPGVTWTAGAVGASIDIAPLHLQVRQVQAALQAQQQAMGRAAAFAVAVADATRELGEAETELAHAEVLDLAPLQAAHDDAYRVYAAAGAEVAACRATVARLQQQAAALAVAAATHAERERAAALAVDQLNTDIGTLAYNNAFLKKLRGLKPAITDYLWNSVLAAVSTFFSSMRGEQSVVTKDAKGFRVNGKGGSLSGSAMDVLALAIRVALTKTFIPQATFLILDEPAHGCDDNRTGNVLGFLSSCGMPQVILASHDGLSESVANNVIALSA